MSLLPRLLLIVLLAILPPVAVQTWEAVELHQQQEQGLHDEALRLSYLAAANLDRIVNGAKQLLVTVATARPVIEGNGQACSNYLARVQSQFPQYTVLYATDRTGHNWCNSGRPAAPVTAAGSNGFEIAKNTEQFTVGDYAVGRFTGKPTLHLVQPVADANGNFQGVVAAGLSLEWLQRYLRDQPWPEGFSLTVTDRQATMLVRFPDTDMVGRPVPPSFRAAWEQAAHADHAATIDAPGLDGKRRIIAYQPLKVPPYGLYISIGLDPDVAITAPARTLWNTLWWVAASLVVGGLAAYLLARTVIQRPIEQLLAAAVRWRDGDYTARSTADGANEFKRLSAKLNDMAARLADREAQLRNASEARRRLLVVAGHDLRQPVQSFAMVIDMLKRRPASPPDPALVARGERAIGRLTRALDDLSEVSRIDSDTLRPVPRVFPIEDLLLELEDHWGYEAHRKGLRFRVVACRTLVETDRDMLYTVLDNLVGNAVRYTERGRVIVGCRRRGNRLVIHVMDTGIGIPNDKIDSIFEEFRQLEPGRGEGMGLGLWIVKKTTDRLGLPLAVHSTVGKGTCFTVEVPRAIQRVASEEMAGRKPATPLYPRTFHSHRGPD